MNLHCQTSHLKSYLQNVFSYGVLLLLISLFIHTARLNAQWGTTSDSSLQVSPWGVQIDASSDSSGGAFIVFSNFSYTKTRYYIQRLGHDGYVKWQTPIMLSDTANLQWRCSVINDGFGNAIASLVASTAVDTFQGKVFYNGKIFVQKVDVKGNKLWGANGIRVSLDTNDQDGYSKPLIVPDDSGGAFVMWKNKPRGIDQPVTDIFVQRIASNGKRIFSDSAKFIASISPQVEPTFMKANSSVVVCFGSDTNSTLEKIDSYGNILWTTSIPNLIYNLAQINNNSFIAIAKQYYDKPNGIASYVAFNTNMATGNIVWENEFTDSLRFTIFYSTIVGISSRQDSYISIVYYREDGVGYYQLLTPEGKLLFGKNGKQIADSTSYSIPRSSVNSTINSTMILFTDNSDARYNKFYVQKIGDHGQLLWTANGYLFSNEFIQNRPVQFFKAIPDGNGGFIALGSCEPVWGVYAKQVSYAGIVGDITTSVKNIHTSQDVQTFELLPNYPNPFNPGTTINYQLPMNSYVTLKIYDILGKEVVTLVNEGKSAGNYSVKFDATKFSSGIYFYRLQAEKYISTKKMLLTK